MTDTATHPAAADEARHGGWRLSASAVARENLKAAEHAAERAREIRLAPAEHKPKLVVSSHVRGEGALDKIADGVNRFCGSMWVFLGITTGIVIWLFAGNIVGFDKTPWPLLLTILNLPQLSIMISLQVSANRAQSAGDKRAIADHETLIALHEMGKQQIDILNGQDKILGMLENFAQKDMPGRQQAMEETVNLILARVSGGQAPPAAPAGQPG
jgi:uncharacterized membrane protein